MNKGDLVSAIATRTGTTKKDVDFFLGEIVEEITRVLVDGGDIKLVGFGVFKTSSRKSRNGRNPKTGDEMIIPATVIPVFKPGKELKARVK